MFYRQWSEKSKKRYWVEMFSCLVFMGIGAVLGWLYVPDDALSTVFSVIVVLFVLGYCSSKWHRILSKEELERVKKHGDDI